MKRLLKSIDNCEIIINNLNFNSGTTTAFLHKRIKNSLLKMMKKLVISDINFDLPERYEPIKLIGKGTYGAVISAIDNLNKEKVAIKKLGKIDDIVSKGRIPNIESFILSRTFKDHKLLL